MMRIHFLCAGIHLVIDLAPSSAQMAMRQGCGFASRVRVNSGVVGQVPLALQEADDERVQMATIQFICSSLGFSAR